MHALVVGRLGTLFGFQPGDQFAHLLRPRAGHDHHRVGRADHHQVLDAGHRGEPPVGMHDAAGRIHGDHRPLHDIARGIAWHDVEQRIPTADIRPAEVTHHHRGTVGFLHHRIIDRLLRRLGEGFRLQAQEAEIGSRAFDRGFNRRRHLRLEPCEFAEQHVGAEQEIPRIPQIAVAHDNARRWRRPVFRRSA